MANNKDSARRDNKGNILFIEPSHKVSEKPGGKKPGYITSIDGTEMLIKQGHDKKNGPRNIFPRLIIEDTISPIMRQIIGMDLSPINELVYDSNNQPAIASTLLMHKKSTLDQEIGDVFTTSKKVENIQNSGLSLAARVFIKDIDGTSRNKFVVDTKDGKIASDFDFDFALTNKLYKHDTPFRSASHFINCAHLRVSYAQDVFLTENFASGCEQIANRSFKPIAMAVDGKVRDLQHKIDKAPNTDAKLNTICAFMRAYTMLKKGENSLQYFEEGINNKLIEEYYQNASSIYQEYGQLIKDSLRNQQVEMAKLAVIVRLQMAVTNNNPELLGKLLDLHPEFAKNNIEWISSIELQSYDKTQIKTLEVFITENAPSMYQKNLLKNLRKNRAPNQEHNEKLILDTNLINNFNNKFEENFGEQIQKAYNSKEYTDKEELIEAITKSIRPFIMEDQVLHYRGRIHEICTNNFNKRKEKLTFIERIINFFNPKENIINTTLKSEISTVLVNIFVNTTSEKANDGAYVCDILAEREADINSSLQRR